MVRNMRTPTWQETDGAQERLGVCMSTAHRQTPRTAHLNVAALELRVFELELREPCIIAGLACGQAPGRCIGQGRA